jgi:hypothetical protein
VMPRPPHPSHVSVDAVTVMQMRAPIRSSRPALGWQPSADTGIHTAQAGKVEVGCPDPAQAQAS